MKRIIVICMALMSPAYVLGQQVLRGAIKDGASGESLQGATVSIQNTFMSAQTDSAGVFRFPDLRAGDYVLRITFLGYAPAERRVTLPQNRPVEVIMEQANYMTEEVLVKATIATANSATAFTKDRQSVG